MTVTREEQKYMEKILKEKNFSEAFYLVTECNWWGNDSVTNDTERENYLYQTYFSYYHVLFTEGVSGIKVEDGQNLLHQLKLQLDKELLKIKRGVYINDEEGENEEKYKVIKDIVKNGKVVAKKGEYLTVYKDYNRLFGALILKRGTEEICDVGSRLEEEHCIKAFD